MNTYYNHFGFFFKNQNHMQNQNMKDMQNGNDDFTQISFLDPLMIHNIRFSKLISQIPDFQHFFSPMSKVQVNNVLFDTSYNKNIQLIAITYPTPHNFSLSSILNNPTSFFKNNNLLILFLIEFYHHIIDSIILLNKFNFSLLSFHPDKIFINADNFLPYISDFSHATKNTHLFKHLHFFKNIQTQPLYIHRYPFEIYVIHFIITHKSNDIHTILSRKNIDFISNFYIDNHPFIQKHFDTTRYKLICTNLLTDYKTFSYEHLILHLLKQYPYWDNYFISITMLQSIYSIFEHPTKIPILSKWIDILIKNINPSFTIRNTLQNTKLLILNSLLH